MRAPAGRVTAIYRDPVFSPRQHLSNDRAILDATLDALAEAGWRIERTVESAVTHGLAPAADCYLNMAQGAAASWSLQRWEQAGLRFVNKPSSVLRCHRERLVPILRASGLRFPRTVLVRTDRSLDPARLAEQVGPGAVWLKRGGVHAEREGDVRLVEPDRLNEGLARLNARGIHRAAIQEHRDGPVIKFYGVTGSDRFFHACLADENGPVPPALIPLETLRELAFRAAARVRLAVFGGDVVVDREGATLIDLNDWPSFAPVRAAAARAIAGYVLATRQRSLSDDRPRRSA